VIQIAYGYGINRKLDSIHEHGCLLARAITSDGFVRAEATPLEIVPNHHGPTWLVLQYNPYSYSRSGVAPGLIRRLVQMRSKMDRIIVFVHEPWIPIANPKSALIGLLQRAQLIAIGLLSTAVIATTETYRSRIARALCGRRRVEHVPVGSNLPDARAARQPTRAKLAIEPGALVVAQISSAHPARLPAHTAAAMRAIAERRPDAVFLNLGAHAPPLEDTGLRIVTPGRVDGPELAALLAASDLFLSPLIDGVSTRRTSVMAALQHEVAVLGTDGHGTGALLRSRPDAIRLTPSEPIDAFADAAAELATDDVARVSLGRTGRGLFDAHFSWPVLARQVVAFLDTELIR
jgi:glycosyltransferase involved in cell wall biosynthesis